jgi:hypothetical protein
MKALNSIVVKGHSGYLIVPIVAIPLVTGAAFFHFRDNLPAFCVENAEKVIGLSGLITLILIVVAIFQRSRSVEARGNQLRYRSWFQDRTVNTATITGVTLETEVSASEDTTSVEHYLSLWCGNRVVLKFNARLWPQPGMNILLRWLKQKVPGLRIDRSAERYMSESP